MGIDSRYMGSVGMSVRIAAAATVRSAPEDAREAADAIR
jgi:hypothetical protein